MLALAAAISYSRVNVGVHWPTDVAAGVILGFASGWVGFRLMFRGWRPIRKVERSEKVSEESREVEYVS